MQFIIELFFEVIFLPFVGIFDSLAAILQETKSPKIRRVQRICASIFVFGLTASLGAGAAAWFKVWSLAIPLIVIGGVGLFIAGVVGSHVEALMKQERGY